MAGSLTKKQKRQLEEVRAEVMRAVDLRLYLGRGKA